MVQYTKMFAKTLLLSVVLGLIVWPLNVLAENQTTNYTTMNGEARLSQALSSQQLNIDDNAKSDIVGKCKNAQIILRNVQLEAEKAVRLRINTYSSIQMDLQSIKLRMLRQGSDASETDLLSGKLQQMIDEFTVEADNYGTTLSDIANVDCVQKPELFMAGLILARTQRAELYKKTTRIKNMIEDSDSNIFTPLKKRLTL